MLQQMPITFTEKQQIQMITGGFDKHIQELTKASKSTTPAELVQFLLSLAISTTPHASSSTQQATHNLLPTPSTSSSSQQLSSPPLRQHRFNSRCHYCGCLGHAKPDCKTRERHAGRTVTCRHCHKVGHLDAACRSKRTSFQSAARPKPPTQHSTSTTEKPPPPKKKQELIPLESHNALDLSTRK